MAAVQFTLISRAAARESGFQRYYTGSPCKHGHISTRYVSTSICTACSEARWRRRLRVAELDAARSNGATQYFTGVPCPRGHIANRFVSSRQCIECAAQRKTNWAKRNVDVVATYNKLHSKRYRQAGGEQLLRRIRERDKKYRDEHRAEWRERKRIEAALRRGMERRAKGAFSVFDIKSLYGAQKGKCVYCKRKFGTKYHIDHIVALSRGGSNWPSNLQLTCSSCNLRKHAKDPIEFAQSRGLLL